MNQGGEPGHDDYGLPRVDIQIPDDARELYRDVQAYHRELRAIRRQERSRRWRAPLRRSGMVVPVIAGCLVLAMIASMVLTMFSANPNSTGIGQTANGGRNAQPGARRDSSASRPSRTSAVTHAPSAGPSRAAGARLPVKTISVAGKPVPLRRLKSTALAIVPAHCRCSSLISQLLAQARMAGVPVYLVGRRGSGAELSGYIASVPSKTAFVAIDGSNVLGSTYKPVGLTILFVDSHGSVTARPVRAGFHVAQTLQSLKSAG